MKDVIVLVLVWSTVVSSFTVESLLDTEENIYHGIWERKVKKSVERTSEFADTSSLLDDVKAYYRVLLDTNFATEESENKDLDADSVESPNYFHPSNRYRIFDSGLQARIPARYMVMFQSRATMDHVTRTVAVMEEVTRVVS